MQKGFRAQAKNKTRHQVYLGQDSAHLLPGKCPCSCLSPLQSTRGQGTDPSSHSQTCWGQQVSPQLQKPHLGHPKAIFCLEGATLPAPALLLPSAAHPEQDWGTLTWEEHGGQQLRGLQQAEDGLLESLAAAGLQVAVKQGVGSGGCGAGTPLPTHGDRAASAPPSTRPCSPNPLLGCSPPVSCRWPQGTQGRAVGQAGQGGGAVGNPLEPPSARPHTRTLSHLLHEVTSCQNSYRMKQASSVSLQAETLWGQRDPEPGLGRLARPWREPGVVWPRVPQQPGTGRHCSAHQPPHEASRARSGCIHSL